MDMLRMFPITYYKYSDCKNPHMMSSSDNRLLGMSSTLYINRRFKIAPLFTMRHHLHLCTYI